MRIPACIAITALLPYMLAAQSADGLGFQDRFRLSVARTPAKIRIDGIAGEQAWQAALPAGNFREKWPNDKQMAKRRTTVQACFDEEYLYFFIHASDTTPYIAQTLKRDNGLYDSDAFSIALDPVNERTNGFLFSVTPYNVQSEDLVTASSTSDELNFSWDNKWFSATRRTDTGWSAEIAIPFKTLRYRADKTVWGINFLRSDLKNNQYSSWTHMPTNFNFFDFGYSGALVWQEPPPPPGTNISFIPYTTGGVRSNTLSGEPTTGRFNAGFDGKVSVTPSLNLDLTLNPDFSQIEVDRQVTNLTRFNIFFPERRTFFLENDDVFSNYGIPPIKPFYSRRIGLDPQGRQIPIIGGLRLSGNIDKRTRIGLMNMQTLARGAYAAQNFTAASFNTRVQSRSLVKGYFLNRQGFTGGKDWEDPLEAFGRNAGLQYDFVDKAGKWNAWASWHHSFKPGQGMNDRYVDLGLGYLTKPLELIIDWSDVGDKYHTDMGFNRRIENYDALTGNIIRRGFRQNYSTLTWRRFPEGRRIVQTRWKLEAFNVWNRDMTPNESNASLSWENVFRSTANLSLQVTRVGNHLPLHTDFTGGGYPPLPPGRYEHWQGGIEYSSDGRRLFIMQLQGNVGGFFNGNLTQLAATLTWRAQPWGNFALYAEHARLRFPHPYGKTDLLLIAPRIEVNFSNSVFWTTFVQLNTQNNNFNVNSRLQWRFRPMSDLFLVYTDNYFSNPFLQQKDRAIVFKLNWWLNL
ncbi:MAG: carbohydrate binding family 9 domain-containing protein [Bacteroidetes bacterium]|nr:carbohydrate binding family 9 domain-containing protein [Bacteroidota bacterium]